MGTRGGFKVTVTKEDLVFWRLGEFENDLLTTVRDRAPELDGSSEPPVRRARWGPVVAIVGIGVNVNQQSEDFSEELRGRAISLAIALDRQVDRHQVATALLRNLDRTYSEAFPR